MHGSFMSYTLYSTFCRLHSSLLVPQFLLIAAFNDIDEEFEGVGLQVMNRAARAGELLAHLLMSGKPAP